MSVLRAIPLWGYFVILGGAFLTGHLLAYRPDPGMARGRRLAGRWGSSLLLLLGLLLVSNRNVATLLPALLLALAGGIVSGRTAPATPDRHDPGRGDASAPQASRQRDLPAPPGDPEPRASDAPTNEGTPGPGGRPGTGVEDPDDGQAPRR